MDVPEPRSLQDWQRRIDQLFGAKDRQRGIPGNFMWFLEEVGELSAALRAEPLEAQRLEFADVLAWLMSLANTAGVDLDQALRQKYGPGCPRCQAEPCRCKASAKP